MNQWSVGIPLVCLLLTGCAKTRLPTANVAGQVTYQGEPVTGGVVLYVPQNGPQATGVLDEQGRYRLVTPGLGTGAVLGPHKVYFTPVFEELPEESYSEEAFNRADFVPQRKSKLKLPSQYLSPQTSGLSAVVKEGNNTNDFTL